VRTLASITRAFTEAWRRSKRYVDEVKKKLKARTSAAFRSAPTFSKGFPSKA
jgi:hypothetical protein